MTDYLKASRGKIALLIGGLMLGFAAAAWRRADPMDFDPWAVD